MSKPQESNPDYDIVIIECCENCETHQQFARHSEWKYFEQFNQLKRKIEKFVNNTIVIKNPVPDQLIKTPEIKNEKNVFMNKDNNEKIIFPRIGSFQIYMYNILIYSKLMTTQWPNHYKVLQTIAKMIEEKKKGNNLDHFSVYSQPGIDSNPNFEQKEELSTAINPDKKNVRILSKKKKGNPLAGRAYKSIDRGNQTLRDPKATLDPLSQKIIMDKQDISPAKGRRVHRYLQSKADTRVKLPSLSNTLKNFKEDDKSEIEPIVQKQKKKVINTIDEIQKQQFSAIEHKNSELIQNQKLSFLDKSAQNFKNSILQEQSQELKFMQNRSVQYSHQDDGKDIMNRSIQYEEEQGFYCDFGMQIDQDYLTKQKELNFHWVQTERVQFKNDNKPYTLDQEAQVNIEVKVKAFDQQSQTIIKQFIDENTGTQVMITVNREIQFPEQVAKSFNINETVDTNFQHLYQKRRNLLNHQNSYSIDRFQEKSSKYKWVGRANLADSTEDLKKQMFLQCLVFSVYNYFGIKTPEKRLSYQMCSNVIGDKLKEGLMHVMTFDNPQLQYLHSFQDFNYNQKKIPFSEIITFKASKQPIKFNNYGGFLALAYFLNDYQIYNQHNTSMGLVIVNEAVKQIHKLSAMNFQIHPQTKSGDDDIIVNQRDSLTMKISRLSVNVELDFFAMLARITDPNNFEQLLKYIKQIFLHAANSYQQFKMTILSLHLEQPVERTVQDFMKMLENRVTKLREVFKGKLYTYKKYHSLTPNIKYSLPFEHKIERKLTFKDKLVNVHDIVKHLRNNNTLVLIQGEEGSGKTTLINEMVSQLKAIQKINVMSLPWLKRDTLKIKSELFQLSKNILFLDNAEQLDAQITELIQSLRAQKCEASYCIATTRRDQIQMFKSRFNTLNIVQTKLIPLNIDEIREYLMKVIKWRSYTDKKDIVEQLVSKNSYIKILQNPFFLSLLSYNIALMQSSSFQITDKLMTKYMILKEHFSLCTSSHNNQMKEMGIKIKQALPSLRRIAFEYYHNVFQVNEVIKQTVSEYEQQQLIRNQLAYYPLCLESVVSANYQQLFVHRIFLDYFLIEAYSYFVQQGFRNMHMERVYGDKLLLQLITQRYKLEDSYNKLLQVVYSTKKFKSIAQASSNAITLLNKIGYVFSNLNFDDVVIPFADLSNSIFYQCSFRSADLQQVIMYKAQMISCIFDAASMNKINLFSKKYEIQFTAITCSISVDGKKLAFGCGNYLIIINAQTGAQMKRIEAHLDIIRLVKFTRDGNSLITIADDKTLRIWDIYTYKSVVFKLPQKGSISYSNQTESIASVNKNILKVWNLKSMANEAQLQGHTQAITTVQFSYDGELILTGSKDSTLRLWTIRGKQKMVFKGHDDEIVAGKLSPVKRTMVSSSKGKDLIVWEVESGSKLLSKKFSSQINEITLDNKEKYIVATFNTDNHIVVLDFLSLEIVHALSGHEAKIMSLSFDHNFQHLVSLGKDRTARVWQFQKIMNNQIRNPKIYKKITKTGITALAFDKVKLRYVTAHQSGEINVWNSQDNSHLDQLHSHNGPVSCLAVDKSSKIYSGGLDGSLRIWNLEVKKQPKIIQIHSTEMLQLRLSERNRFIATSSAANQLVIQDFTGIKIIMSTREEGRISAIAFSADQKYMAVGGAEKYVAIYEMVNASSVHRAIELGVHTDPISSICFYSQALVVVALKNGQVAIWNYQKVSLIKKIENVSPIKSLMLFQKKYLTLSSEDGKIRIVNMDEGRQVRVFKYSEPAAALDTNDDQSLLVVGTSKGNLLKWNLNCVKPPSKKIEFDRKAIDRDCSQLVTIEGARVLLVKDLLYHKETLLEVKVDSDIQGVTFDQQKIIMLLKNGKYWQYGKKQYRFNTSSSFEGDLFSIRDKNITNFYKSGIKKIKGMNKPSLSIIEEVNLQ